MIVPISDKIFLYKSNNLNYDNKYKDRGKKVD